jgi:DNA repair exonuclease SbcCD ATPase subunit
MNIDEVRTIVRERFGEVDQVSEAVLKASSRLGGTPFALWVFDCTQTIVGADFDLQAYQDHLLRNEFYRFNGSLQWNLYCCFLCDEDRLARLERSGVVEVIERDTTYARKFVRTPAMLRHDFKSLAAIAGPTISELPEDIAALWQQKLADNGLASVCSDLPYTEIVRQVKSGNAAEELDGEISEDIRQLVQRIESVDAIDLDRFRYRPKKRQFSFGSCNLIYGVNGAGKTSLLEAIEAWICGRHRRNPEIPLLANCLKLKIWGSEEWQTGPESGSALYRQRDHAWYGNYQARKNDLYANFARFSFFDADAAARLEISDDDLEIKHALSHLVLGGAAAKIAERMEKILPMLQKEERDASRTIRNAEEIMKSAQDSITSLQVPTETRKKAYERLRDKLQSVGWRADPPQDSADECLALLDSLNGLKARVELALADLPWMDCPSVNNIEKEQQALTACTSGIETVRKQTAALTKQKNESACDANEYGKWVEMLHRCLAYTQTGAVRLLDSVEELARSEQRKKSLTTAAEALASIDISQFDGVNETAGDMAARVHHDLEEHSKIATKARQTVKSLESVHGRIEGLLAEIRARAEELLSTAPKTATCPVCGATYVEGELQKRLEHQAMHVATPELLQAHSELARLQKQQERLSRILRDLDTLLSIGRDTMGLSTPAVEPVSKLVASIMFLERSIAQCDIDISRLEHDRDQLEAKGFNVEELQYLNEELSRLSPDSSLGDADQLRRLLEEMASQQKVAVQKAADCDIALADAEQKTQAVLIQYSADGGTTVEIITDRMAKISRVVGSLCEIGQILDIDVGRSFSDIVVDLDSLRQSVEGFVRLKQQEESVVQVIDENEMKITASRAKLEHERPVRDHLRVAVAVLEELRLEHGADKYFEGFFSENLHQISDLFCTMHAPREFCDVVWQQNDPMAIRAVRKANNAACSVAELSSGQRNALALAIFLTMNRKITQAPSLILLDDPVAHVDDLNIVSFLDCLRELLTGFKRQVFFATASAKTAHLFARKFDYLGDEAFRSFHLTP